MYAYVHVSYPKVGIRNFSPQFRNFADDQNDYGIAD
jgi:hypothetical protein